MNFANSWLMKAITVNERTQTLSIRLPFDLNRKRKKTPIHHLAEISKYKPLYE